MKMGRIHRCENCETKCDETYSAKSFKVSWGQETDEEIYYFCCVDCEKYFVRENSRASKFEPDIASFNEIIPQLMELLSTSLKRGEKIPCLFETIRYFKLVKQAYEMLLSQAHN